MKDYYNYNGLLLSIKCNIELSNYNKANDLI